MTENDGSRVPHGLGNTQGMCQKLPQNSPPSMVGMYTHGAKRTRVDDTSRRRHNAGLGEGDASYHSAIALGDILQLGDEIRVLSNGVQNKVLISAWLMPFQKHTLLRCSATRWSSGVSSRMETRAAGQDMMGVASHK